MLDISVISVNLQRAVPHGIQYLAPAFLRNTGIRGTERGNDSVVADLLGHHAVDELSHVPRLDGLRNLHGVVRVVVRWASEGERRKECNANLKWRLDNALRRLERKPARGSKREVKWVGCG